MSGIHMGEEKEHSSTHLTIRESKAVPRISGSSSPQERKLYEPVRRALQKRFSDSGSCFIEVTADGLSDEVKKLLPEQSMFMMLQERKRPDLIGQVWGPARSARRRLVVEVKPGILTLDDIYQLKLYADMLSSDLALLISPKGLNYERIAFLRGNPQMLSYLGGERTISVLTFDIATEALGFVEELPQQDPFQS